MDVGIVEAVLANIAAQMAGVVQALVPLGTALAGSFLVLSILLLGLNLIVGGSFTTAIVRSMGAAAATFWAIQQWPDLVMGTLTASRDIIGLFIGGYGGPTDLFQAAAEVTARVMVEPAGWSWSVSGAVAAMAQHFLISLSTVFIAIGLAMPGIMAILAELSLLLGAAAAPLILPALAFPGDRTARLGCGQLHGRRQLAGRGHGADLGAVRRCDHRRDRQAGPGRGADLLGPDGAAAHRLAVDRRLALGQLHRRQPGRWWPGEHGLDVGARCR